MSARVRAWASSLLVPAIYHGDGVTIIRLNRALPTSQGFTLRDKRPKTCFNCSLCSDSEFNTLVGSFSLWSNNPYQIYECGDCTNLGRTYGKERTEIDQALLEEKKKAQVKRNVEGRDILPDRCD